MAVPMYKKPVSPIAGAGPIGAGVGASVGAPKPTPEIAPNAGVSTPKTSYFDKNFGGQDKYVQDQINRYQTAVNTNDTGMVSKLQGDAKRVGYMLPQTKSIFTPGSYGNVDPAAWEKTQLNNQIAGYQGQMDSAKQTMLSQVGQNDAYLKEQLAGLGQSQAVDNQNAQELQNRRGGFYSGGLDYQLGGIDSAYANQRGQLSREIASRNQSLIDQYGTQANTIADQINNLQQSAPDIIRQRVQDWINNERNYGLNYAGTFGNLNGQQTAQQAQQQYSNQQAQKAANLQAAAQVSDMTGKVITPQADWTGLYRQAADPNMPLTMAGQNQQFNQDLTNTQTMAALTGHMPDGKPTTAEQQRQLGNLWTEAEQTGTIPNQLADMYGIPRGTQTQAAYQFAKGLSMDWYNAQTSRQNANNAQDQTYLDYIGANNKQTANAQTVPPAAAGQILHQSLSKVVGNDPLTGKPVYGTITDPASREQAFIETWNTSGVAPGPDTVEMLSKAGYTAAEIAKYQQKYPQAFQPAAQ